MGLIVAIERHNVKLAEVLLHHHRFQRHTRWALQFAASEAVKSGNVEMARLVFQFGGASSHFRGSNLELLIEGKHLQIAELLIANGIDVDTLVGDCVGEPLRLAAMHGWKEGVWLLLVNGADVHANDDQALVEAAENGHLEVVRMLLLFGADACAQDNMPAAVASENAHIAVLGLLFAHGATLDFQDPEALGMATFNGRTNVVESFLLHGAELDESHVVNRSNETHEFLKSLGFQCE